MTHLAPITIRLTGGIGGHLLGMRTLALAHARMPGRRIVIYSECASDPVALKVAAMSPFVSEVIAVMSTDSGTETDAGIDASGDDLFAQAAIALRMPLFELLAARPVLQIPAWAATEADQLLHGQHASSFVGVCFSGDEPETLRREATRLASFESSALNFADYTDLPIEVIAALLSRCRYFVGGDNGIKHLAWALDIPRTFFVKERPPRLDVLRWMPDVHRLLTFDCGEDRLRRHLVGNGKARED